MDKCGTDAAILMDQPMTEDIGSDAAKRPQEVEIALLKERIRESYKRDAQIMSRLDEIKAEQIRQATMLALGNQRFDAIEESQDETTERLLLIENDKRGPVALIFGTISAIGVAAVAIWTGFRS